MATKAVELEVNKMLTQFWVLGGNSWEGNLPNILVLYMRQFPKQVLNSS